MVARAAASILHDVTLPEWWSASLLGRSILVGCTHLSGSSLPCPLLVSALRAALAQSPPPPSSGATPAVIIHSPAPSAWAASSVAGHVQTLAFTAVAASAINIGGGFTITKRMLSMFQRPTDPVEYNHLYALPGAVLVGGCAAGQLAGTAACRTAAASVCSEASPRMEPKLVCGKITKG